MTDLSKLRARTDEILDSVTVSKEDFEELCAALELILKAEFGFDMYIPEECERTYWGKARAILAKVRK